MSDREMEMLNFALKVANNSEKISSVDYEALYPYGFSDEDIWDIAAITSFFGMSNRLANLPICAQIWNFSRWDANLLINFN
ncbi:MAG: hypothetical protein CM15mP1_0990 [Methanobacteriota archaeon]|nr:MAG: hypothetical protein CM15mP1_0990 [Euryarchaeota archaeon]